MSLVGSPYAGFGGINTPYKKPRISGIPATYRGQRVVPRFQRGVLKRSNERSSSSMAKRVRFARRVRYRPRRGRRNRRRGGYRRYRIPSTVVPPTKLVRMPMVFPYNANVASTTPTGPAFRVFNIVDPMGTSGTAQPTGLDQYGAVYQNALVVGVKVTMTAHNAGAQGVVCGITPIPEAIGTAGMALTWDAQCEFPGTSYRFLSPEMDHITLTRKFSTKKWMRIKDWKDNKTSVDRHCTLGTTGTHTDCTNTSDIINCWVALHNGTTSTAFEVIIKVEYLVLLFNRRLISRSTD